MNCETQDEVDYFWDKLSEGGATAAMRLAEGQVRPLLADRPVRLPRLLTDPDPAKANRVMQAMLQMTKIDIARLEQAAKG